MSSLTTYVGLLDPKSATRQLNTQYISKNSYLQTVYIPIQGTARLGGVLFLFMCDLFVYEFKAF